MVFSILQWNARSLCSNGQEFKKFVENLDARPNVICVQETWLRPHLDFVLQGYVSVRRDREKGPGGGVAVFVMQGLGYRTLKVSREVEGIIIEVWIGNSNFLVVNYYNPCEALNKGVIDEFLGDVSHKMIWCGDLNAYSTLWGSTVTNSNGKVVEEVLEERDLICLNDGRDTRIDISSGRETVIDLTLVSAQFARCSKWNVIQDDCIGSDHYPILCEIGVGTVHTEDVTFPRWNFKKAKWDDFSMNCSARLMSFNVEQYGNVNDVNSRITEILHSSALQFIGKTTRCGQRKMVPWWTDECREAIQVRNNAFKKVKSTFSFADLVEYKRAQAMVRKVIRKAKRERRGAFCDTIGRDTSFNDVWGMIRRMGGIRREFSLPAIQFNEEIMRTDKDKAEALAKVFVRIHSVNNLSPEAREAREEMVRVHPNVLEKKLDVDNSFDVPFSMFELKRAMSGVRSTSPGKDEICYIMVEKLCPQAQMVLLQFFNMIWETGNIPPAWKHSVVVPILKPGKEKSEATSYRPIALTSNLCKIMERMATDRLTYIVEKRGLISSCQSGFRRGRMTMDPVLCLEDTIRKAQANKEQVNAVFFDIEKAYNMLWREGLLIKLKAMGISCRLYNWVMDFLLNRTIEVRVGQSHSNIYHVDNGVPQGSVCSPLLFSIMINDIFSDMDVNIGRSLYADDGALWYRGRNLAHISQKLQSAVSIVENWGIKWGFRSSVEKTQVICFTKRRIVPPVHITLYGQPLKQVEVVRFLGVWMDCKLTFRDHIQRIVVKCKKAVNILRCLVGSDWGATMTSLKHVYIALIRSTLDYACIAYRSAAKTHLKKLDVIQAQALRVCSGAFRTSSVPALQVESGEMPLVLRCQQLAMVYWTNLQGHKEDHPTKHILTQCWEHGKANFNSFGWIGNSQAGKLGLTKLSHSSVVPLPHTPPCFFVMPTVDIALVKMRDEVEEEKDVRHLTNVHIRTEYPDGIQIFTDGSKDPATGKTAAAVFIPKYKKEIQKRLSDHLAVYSVELFAICLALEWIEEVKTRCNVICSDSLSALTSILHGKSVCRPDLLYDVLQSLFRLHQQDILVIFVWVPSHSGIEGNEVVDQLAKDALNSEIQINIPLSKAEVKHIIVTKMIGEWQGQWDRESKGSFLRTIKKTGAHQKTVQLEPKRRANNNKA